MKKSFKAHHTITAKGGRVASRKRQRPDKIIASRPRPLDVQFYFVMPPGTRVVIVPASIHYKRRVKGLQGLDILGR